MNDHSLKPTTARGMAIASRPDDQSLTALLSGSGGLHYINPFKINIKPNFNARVFDADGMFEHLGQLSLSISQIGLQRPLDVYVDNNEVWLYDGECRLRSVIKAIEQYNADINQVQVIVAPRSVTEADRTLALVTHNAGKQLTTLEQGQVYKRLMSFGWSKADIAQKAGVPQYNIERMIDLQTLPEVVKGHIRDNRISSTLAATIMKAHRGKPQEIISLVEEAIENAEKSGKKRTSARFAKAPRFDFKKDMKSIIKRSIVEKLEEEQEVIISMTASDWEMVSQMCGIEK
jgi:hypothetical protein